MSSTDTKRLRKIDFKDRYRSGTENIVRDFYVPALTATKLYSRAVGYFSSGSLSLFAEGLGDFTDRGGRIRIVASPQFNADDISDMERGYDIRGIIERAALRGLADLDDAAVEGLGRLGSLIAMGRLDIKLAFVSRGGHYGTYHEKIGTFRDAAGDYVAFSGSANETFGGLVANFESVDVYRSWDEADKARAARVEQDFENLWLNRTTDLKVEDFPDVARDRLIEIASARDARGERDQADDAEQSAASTTRLSIPQSVQVRGYQRKAVEAWLGNRGRGVLKMATGTGKTKTALIAATKLSEVLQGRGDPLVVVIVAPYQHLVDQWLGEVESFGVRPVAVYESSKRWLSAVESQLSAARLGQRSTVVLVATNASFASERFQSILERNSMALLVIADEAHNLGSAAYRSALPEGALYRLALSATPERWFDDEGTDAINLYFGRVIFELGLEQAIGMKALCRYEYIPRIVELTDREGQLYGDLTTQIARRMTAGDSLDSADPSSPLGFLLRQRAGVLGHAERKIEAVRNDLESRRRDWFQLVYCAEGRSPSGPGELPGANQVESVLRMIGNELGLSAQSYISETPRLERKVLLKRFGTGDDLRVLVAMRCLDEGVDIPDARTGYLLASSSNPRQFIQRRGRLLRPAPGKERAVIFDYIAVPPSGVPVNFNVERQLLIRELLRANEFGKISDNYEATLETLQPLKEKYQLLHM